MVREMDGRVFCPFKPHHHGTFVFVGPRPHSSKHLYAAIIAKLSDPLIYREPLRTEKFNVFNAPNFVSSLHHEDHVFFFFRENAVEYTCGKRVFSRVARVCTKDKGGPSIFRNSWTSFLKARLNCSVPGDYPFYFDEIQSTTGVVEGIYNGKIQKIIYGVFTTPQNSVGASAVCAFRMQDINDVFNGPFKEQINPNFNWKAVENSRVPDPRPGQCVNDSTHLPETNLRFIRSHPLMHLAVPFFWNGPVLIRTSMKFRFTKIAVDPQIETMSGQYYDVLFIGTDDGRVIKAINSASNAKREQYNFNQVVPVIIEDISIFRQKTVINNLMVY
ncbi:semaphorin-1A-like isoform X2, partial [Dinothrombium tinctorium]